MAPRKEKVVVKLNGEQIPFIVNSDEEPYYRQANDILDERLKVLNTDYSAFAGKSRLVSVLAIEALVDALKVNERYQSLRLEIEDRLNNIQEKFEN